jgi:hypothetical protein
MQIFATIVLGRAGALLGSSFKAVKLPQMQRLSVVPMHLLLYCRPLASVAALHVCCFVAAARIIA